MLKVLTRNIAMPKLLTTASLLRLFRMGESDYLFSVFFTHLCMNICFSVFFTHLCVNICFPFSLHVYMFSLDRSSRTDLP